MEHAEFLSERFYTFEVIFRISFRKILHMNFGPGEA
jgi:hypothetical protein